jgi:hypothetical protein
VTETPQKQSTTRRVGRFFTVTNVAVTGLIALASGVLAVLFDVAPGLRPDPRDSVGAEIQVLAVEPGVSIEDWINRGFAAPDRARELRAVLGQDPEPSERKFAGEVVYVKLDVTGFKRRRVYLRQAVYDARTHEQVPRDRLGGPAVPAVRLIAPNERTVRLLWIPDLTFDSRARHFVRVELRDDRGILALADSRVLVGGRMTSPR